MDRNRVWVAGRINRDDVPEVVWREIKARFYNDGALRDEVELSEVAAYASAILPLYEVKESVENDGPSNRKRGATGPKDMPPPTLERTSTKVRAEALTNYLAYVVELEGSLMPETMNLLRTSSKPDRLLEQIGGETPTDPTEDCLDEGVDLERVRQDLRELSERILGYWNEVEVAKVIMDPENIILRSPIRSEIEVSEGEALNYGTVTITVEPWVPLEIVANTYSYYQTRLYGRRPRSFSARNVEVARFAFERVRKTWRAATDEAEEWKSLTLGTAVWRGLAEEWNERFPDFAYTEMNLFRRDVTSTLRQMLRPYGAFDERNYDPD